MRERDFRVLKSFRENLGFEKPLFSTKADIKTFYSQSNNLAFVYNEKLKKEGGSDSSYLSASKLNASAILHKIYHKVLTSYVNDENPDMFTRLISFVKDDALISGAIDYFNTIFPSKFEIFDENVDISESLRSIFIYHVVTNNNAMTRAIRPLVNDSNIDFPKGFRALESLLGCYIKSEKFESSNNEIHIFDFLIKPAKLYPNNLSSQINFILKEWKNFLDEDVLLLLKSSLTFLKTEEKERVFAPNGKNNGPSIAVPDYSGFDKEYASFSADTDWMPRVVMIAKSTLVYLDQLSKEYEREINTLNEIPDEELDKLKDRGFTALWLIGLWNRSIASKEIKRYCGNAEAEASAYSLEDYEISSSLGGWPALQNLKERCLKRGIRLAADMVPNHTGLDSTWIYEHPEYFVSQSYSPFPSYTFKGPDLSKNPNVEIKLEDHYFTKTDAAVTFLRKDKNTGEEKYIFHGNDGTTMPWNDTAQLDFLNPITREAVIQKIIHVASNFPIIRFDAAMTLAKKHIQRLWYPKYGEGGDIPGRVVYAMTDEDFNKEIPKEFWREVVDRIAKEVPDTLLLAEAFWMMEGYFVRTLGMHRVYNSAFMNMLKNHENAKYRQGIKSTLAFEPEILKRYVNFMNNPDEEPAIEQFGSDDRYFSVCTIMATLPGLPMFGHGQFEGYREKYGMEYKKAYFNERANEALIHEHKKRITPLLQKRYLFSGVENFNLYDAYYDSNVEESVFAYSNGIAGENAVVIVNNQVESVNVNIKNSVSKINSEKNIVNSNLFENLNLSYGGRNYLIYEDYETKLTHLVPSLKIYEEGFTFHLEGYESKILWRMREVDDMDGSYAKLYQYIGLNGVSNIKIVISQLRIEPMFNLLDNFRSSNFFKSIELLIYGHSNRDNDKSLLLTIADTYIRLVELSSTLGATTVEALPSYPRDIDPSEMIGQIRNLTKLFQSQNEDNLFAAYAKIEPELSLLIAASIVLKPFIEEDCATFKDALVASDKLLLYYFFENKRSSLNLSREDLHMLMHFAAIYSVLGYIVKDYLDKSPLEILEFLLTKEEIRNCVKCNEYDNIVWYKKELMQQLIIVSALSIAVFSKDKTFNLENYVSTLMKKEALAEYQIDKLLKK